MLTGKKKWNTTYGRKSAKPKVSALKALIKWINFLVRVVKKKE